MINANDDSGEVKSEQSPCGDRFTMQSANNTKYRRTGDQLSLFTGKILNSVDSSDIGLMVKIVAFLVSLTNFVRLMAKLFFMSHYLQII